MNSSEKLHTHGVPSALRSDVESHLADVVAMLAAGADGVGVGVGAAVGAGVVGLTAGR